jgi:hypothetical protein
MNLQKFLQQLVDKFDTWFGGGPYHELGSESQAPAPEVQAAETSSAPTLDEIIQAIQQGSQGDPVATMAAQMANTGQNMNAFQENPFLSVAISQLESRGFKDFAEKPEIVNKPKQGYGWAPGIEGYNPPIEQVLADMMSAVGTDRKGQGEVRERNAGYYKNFRENPSDIMGFANQYAGPITEQNPNAGDVYGNNLKSVMNMYADILDKILKQRGSEYSKRY